MRELLGFLRDSTPARRRSRYGDLDYDWEQRVNTTAGAVDWRTRLLGVFHSPYQPTEPALFREMMAALPIDFREFTFIDIGSGKGRTLLLAAQYPFRKIVGVELIRELHRAAEENVAAWRTQSPARQAASIETRCMDAREFVFPIRRWSCICSIRCRRRDCGRWFGIWRNPGSDAPREIWIVYHNPLLESVLAQSAMFVKEVGKQGYSLFHRAFRRSPQADVH